MTGQGLYWSAGRADQPSSGRAVGPSEEARLLLVVRHGDAGSKGSWNGPDSLRPLSPAGRRQAAGLVLRLEDYPVEQILSSPAVRCQQTVQPLARDRSLPIEPVSALGVDAGPDQLRTMLLDRRLRRAVLCTHGETFSQLFTLLVEDGLTVQEPPRCPKGSTWLVRRTRLHVHARYLPPLELGPAHARWPGGRRDYPNRMMRDGSPSEMKRWTRRPNRPIERKEEPWPSDLCSC